jgi:ABC-2 type transport system permease protein
MASIVSTLLTVVGPLGYWIYKGGLRTGKLVISDSTYEGIVAVPSSVLGSLGLFIVIALTMGMIVREQDLGTLQWVFTKPLSRSGLVIAKWLANSLMTVLTIVVIPTVVSFGAIDAMFGVHDRDKLILGMVGIAVLFVFQCALSCGISAIFNSTSAVAGISFALFFLPLLVAPFIHDWSRLIPSQIATVASNFAQGDKLEGWDYATIASTLITTVLLMVFAARRLTKREYR